ncbi:MAG: DUF6578 domain-containing protein [Pseudonocardia sp.]
MSSARTVVPVWLAGWQHECCGEPFAVGDAVRWLLTAADGPFLARVLGPLMPQWSAELPVRGSVTSGSMTFPVLGLGDLAVVGEPGPGARRTVGLLAEEHHDRVPPDSPTTAGRVRSIRVVRWRYEPDPDEHGLRPVAGSATVEQMHASDRWPRPVGDSSFHGFLVELDVRTG